jgi:hypothetical protein
MKATWPDVLTYNNEDYVTHKHVPNVQQQKLRNTQMGT